jgi:ribonuclease T2
MRFSFAPTAALLCLLGAPVSAQVPLQGNFLASKSCAALQSIRKQGNPGNMSVEVGKSYRLLGKNKEQATHYWIEMPGATPPQRWVATDCGAIGEMSAEVPSNDGGAVSRQDGLPFYVLALSWEPAFCEGLPDKTECKKQTPESFDASHLSLHGLWPQPRRIAFCGVEKVQIEADDAHRWEGLPEPELTPATKSALDHVMPGTQSLLQRHEWIKHGTCYPGGSAETYFKDAVRLATAINDSPVREFIAANVGKTVQSSDIRARFDEAFGAGAGDRVRVACKSDGGRQLIVELTVGLKGDIPSGTGLPALIAASRSTDPGCPAGVIDPVGLQ